MSAKRVYLLDGQEISFTGLIRAAKECGYEGEGGMFFTSQAARVLRENGHTVEERYVTEERQP